MRSLRARLVALEGKPGSPASIPWVRVIQAVGQSEADAIAEHESRGGALGDANVILRVVV